MKSKYYKPWIELVQIFSISPLKKKQRRCLELYSFLIFEDFDGIQKASWGYLLLSVSNSIAILRNEKYFVMIFVRFILEKTKFPMTQFQVILTLRDSLIKDWQKISQV